ncbi:nucleotidyltransferase domain-containing protein [Candidatus Woesearchaeota archaeon]|nr:nucleotidyltransferase domain-containing protein [Candidatus Woesearchaeota archaeon]
MDTYHIKWTNLQSEIFRLLCIKAGTSLNLRSIARHLKKSPTAVSNALKGLKKEELINVKKIENLNLLSIELNRDNSTAIELKRVENLKIIYESQIIKTLRDNFPGSTIILFGSYSKGEDINSNKTEEYHSDIDIAIIGTKEKNINLTKFDKLLERRVVLNFYPSFKEIHKHLKDNILNGIILSGSVDL